MIPPDSPSPFEVYPYDIEKLRSLLAQKSGANREVVDGKIHTTYFKDYFHELDAKTIVVENKYIDRDFLEDFAAYYVRCFHDYKRFCTRLHFFRSSFTQADFESLLEGQPGPLTEKLLNDNYLGFVVVKPLPQTIVGRTCLKTYPDDGGRRNYPIVRPNKATLFGIELNVNTLAFQEQDHVAAACATSALWSAFQGTGHLFQHRIPSPVEITKAANERFPVETRTLPSRGLTIRQMAHAISCVGLEPLPIEVFQNPYILKSSIFAYLRGGIPVLLLLALFDAQSIPHQRLDLHAVTVTGFGVQPGETPDRVGERGFLSRAGTIDRLYAHDDQVGPFARMILDGEYVEECKDEGIPIPLFSLSTNWQTRLIPMGKIRAVPLTVLIPLYHKIRIPFSRTEDAVIEFDSFLEELRLAQLLPFTDRLVWEVYLTTVNDMKKGILSNSSLAPRLRQEFLTRSQPRFMWRATATHKDVEVLDLLFDATDIEQGRLFVTAIEYDLALSRVLRKIAEPETLDGVLQVLEPTVGPLRSVREILEQFRP